MGYERALRVLFGAWLITLCPWQPATAIFRFDEIEPRDFDYSDDYFINVFSYRERLTHRWLWKQAAIGYHVTAGSLSSDELYLTQEAIARVPFTNWLSGGYRFIETEDYDARFSRNEAELVIRLMRPPERPPLLETLGETPAPDGLFFGIQTLLDDRKELADGGVLLGYGTNIWSVRLDLWLPDFSYNGKNDESGEYDTSARTVVLSFDAWLRGAGVRLSAWIGDDLPLRLSLPQREGLVFRYRQLQAGFTVSWSHGDNLRLDLDVFTERTRKSRRSTINLGLVDDFAREALKVQGQGEYDVPALLGERASRARDTVLFGFFLQSLNEITDRLLLGRDRTVRRGEGYVELGYLLSMPSPDESVDLGVRVTGQTGMLSFRDVREQETRHSVSRRFLAKSGLGVELSTREDRAYAFFQFTFRLDEPSFGGGNGQVMFRF